MKKLAFILLILTAFCIKTHSQPDTIRGNFIYLSNGSLIQSPHIKYYEPILGSPFFEVDRAKYPESIVNFVRIDDGYYANLRFLSDNNVTLWGKCFSSGKLDFFEHVTISTNGTTGGIARKFYYCNDFGKLKIANYKNLKTDLADNPNSRMYLDEYKSLCAIELSVYLVSGGMIIGGILKNISEQETDEMAGIPILIAGGVIFSINGWAITTIAKPRLLKKSARIYNTSY